MAEHKYSGDCDITCNKCEEITRDALAEHTYNGCNDYCSVCYEGIREVTHNIIHVEAAAATCGNDGNIEYWYCDSCGAAWLDAECHLNTNLRSVKLPATGEHTYSHDGDTKCNVCGDHSKDYADDAEKIAFEIVTFAANSATEADSSVGRALAFAFNVKVEGIAFGNGYEADYTHAYVTVNGESVKLEGLGAVVFNSKGAVQIPAKYLFAIAEDNTVTYAARIINIPDHGANVPLTAYAYYVLEGGIVVELPANADSISYDAYMATISE
jgi:hypothetical protein